MKNTLVIIMLGVIILLMIGGIIYDIKYSDTETTTTFSSEEIDCEVAFKNTYDDRYYIGVYFCNEIQVIEVTQKQYDAIIVDSVITIQIINDKLITIK